MNVLLTGASGYVGSHIHRGLAPDHVVTTVGRQPLGHRHISCNLAAEVPDLSGQYIDYVVHAAGKAHSVPRRRRELAEYEQVNVQGTARLLASLDRLPTLPQAIVHISTVLVYGRDEGYWLTEDTALQDNGVYGLSKIKAETLVREWAQRTGVRAAILRLPLVVAEEPTGNMAALMTAIRRGYYVRLGDGAARRSMVRADDLATIIPRAAAIGGVFNLTDGHHPSLRELDEMITQYVGRTRVKAVPTGLAKAVARAGDGVNALIGRKFPLDSVALRKLTSSLTFSDQAARQRLNWNPRPVLDLFV
ncbi:NAD-dependent epimerase/dehydratase family protein [Fibrisoma montanum]|uniref:NAD-dependent epimerase/dehydratase family protein n=1 Tax=Fibrisoma montanum TaxID=2305895 RepID=A0A418M181_9BACT|nr:NAD-dependent epimerase/dehydratase family protein [Fibrisoma montanum]RIV19381.1 NAD-dependent epimerase/dehydratase family protein [Fibrisoma montanum]